MQRWFNDGFSKPGAERRAVPARFQTIAARLSAVERLVTQLAADGRHAEFWKAPTIA
jgi:hypothetical protein